MHRLITSAPPVLLGTIAGSFALSQVVVSSDAHTRPPRASDSELQLIREYLGLDRWDLADRSRILSTEAYRWSEDAPYDLVAFLWFVPVFAQDSICIAHEYVSYGWPEGDGYAWSYQERYHHWLGQTPGDCMIESVENLPPSVATSERIATGVMIQILDAEDEILQQALSQLDAGTSDVDASADWRLSEVRLSSSLDTELGFAYDATFRAPGQLTGPTCAFTMKDGEIVVNGAGYWVA